MLLVNQIANVYLRKDPMKDFRFHKLVYGLLLVMAYMVVGSVTSGEDWYQGAGPNGNFQVQYAGPSDWSVVQQRNIAWKLTLPETGQSTPVVCKDRVFFTTYEEVPEDSELGNNIVAWCVHVRNGRVLWKRDIPGKYPLRLSGCFGDSTSPPAVCDGERVVFVNASGRIACFDLKGNPLWSREILSVNRTLPFLIDGKFVFTRQVYPPDSNGAFPHKYAEAPPEMWTQLQALDIQTGHEIWTTKCGVNMGNAIVPQRLPDGRDVAVVGRGGGHGPPEKPAGVSLVNLADGSTIWTLPLEGFMSTASYCLYKNNVCLFHQGDHLTVAGETGEILSKVSIIMNIPTTVYGGEIPSNFSADLRRGKNKRMITQTSNLLVGKYHYFRSYVRPWLGRVNVETGDVEYLQLPLQIDARVGKEDEYLYYDQSKDAKPLKLQTVKPNSMKNSRGFKVFGDQRSQGSGWGHIASSTPTVAGRYLYLPVINGTVFVIDWNVESLDHRAVVDINDLGPAGEAYHRASLSIVDGRLFAHTIRELICIQEAAK